MSKITVKFYATLREKIKTDYVGFKADTFMSVIKILIKMYPLLEEELLDEDFKLKDRYVYLVNGRNIVFLKGIDTPLKDGDGIAILSPVAGG